MISEDNAAAVAKLLQCGADVWCLPMDADAALIPLPSPEEIEKAKSSKPSKPSKSSVIDDSDSGGPSGSDSGEVSDPEEIAEREHRLMAEVNRCKKRFGLDHEKTLGVIFKLASNLIGQYKLNMTESLLNEIMDVCKVRGGDWHIKAIQSLAFVRWKQYRFKDALELFDEQERIMGPSAALCENIGHTYNSLGDFDKAEEYFEKALEMLNRGSYGNKGGIYLGLGLVRDRLGKTAEALPILQQALEHYKEEHVVGQQYMDSSIIAKAHMSVGRALEKMERLPEAASHMRDALSMFQRTVGDSSPLTANAHGCLGKVLWALGNTSEATSQLKQALKLEIDKDAFRLETVWELLNQLKDIHAKHDFGKGPGGKVNMGSLNSVYTKYLPLIKRACNRINALGSSAFDDGTVAVFYKTSGEVCLLAGDYNQAEVFLEDAVAILRTIPNFDCSSLISSCDTLLKIVEANRKKP